MELEDLKKSWNALDEQLKSQKFVKDEDICRLIQNTGKNISAIGQMNRRALAIAIPLLLLSTIGYFREGLFYDPFYIMVFILALPALCWDLFCLHYLKKTNIEEMPLVKVIARLNRFHSWMIGERVAGIAFVLILAAVFFYDRHVWQASTGVIIFFFVFWGLCFGFILWIYQKKIMTRIKDIKKNLSELKELNL